MEFNKLQNDRKRIVKLPVGQKENGEVEYQDLAIWHRPLTPQVDDKLREIYDEIDHQGLAKRKAEMVGEEKEKSQENGEGSADPSKPSQHVLVAQLEFLLTKWSVTKDGQELPVSREILIGLEWETLWKIRDVIFEPIFPKATT